MFKGKFALFKLFVNFYFLFGEEKVIKKKLNDQTIMKLSLLSGEIHAIYSGSYNKPDKQFNL